MAGKENLSSNYTPFSVVRPRLRLNAPAISSDSRANESPSDHRLIPTAHRTEFQTPGNQRSDVSDASWTPSVLKDFTNFLDEYKEHIQSSVFAQRNEQLELENKELKAALNSTTARMHETMKQIITMEADNSSILEPLKEELSDARSRAEQAELGRREAERKVQKLQTQIENLHLYVNNLPSIAELNKLTDDLFFKEQEISRLEEVRAFQEGELEISREKVTALSVDNQHLQQKVKELKLQLAREKTINEKQEQRKELAAKLDPLNVEEVMADNDRLSTENSKLKRLIVDVEKCRQKESTLAATEKLKLQSSLENQTLEAKRLKSDLDESQRMTSFLRDQVESRSVELEKERQKNELLRQDLHMSSCVQELRQDLLKMEKKLFDEFQRCIHDVSNLVEAQTLMSKGQSPYEALFGNLEDGHESTTEKYQFQDYQWRFDETKRLLDEMKDWKVKIEELRQLTLDRYSTIVADSCVLP